MELIPSQMGLSRFLQHAVGILPYLGVIRRLFLNYWSECGGTGEEEQLRNGLMVWELIVCQAGPVNTSYHISECKKRWTSI